MSFCGISRSWSQRNFWPDYKCHWTLPLSLALSLHELGSWTPETNSKILRSFINRFWTTVYMFFGFWSRWESEKASVRFDSLLASFPFFSIWVNFLEEFLKWVFCLLLNLLSGKWKLCDMNWISVGLLEALVLFVDNFFGVCQRLWFA